MTPSTLQLIQVDPDAAHQELVRRPELIDPTCETQLRWLASRAYPVIPPAWRPAFEVAGTPASPTRRLALKKLGATAWYEGRGADAERYWMQAAFSGPEVPDANWYSALNNIALLYLTAGRSFEALTVSGIALRAGRNTPKPSLLFSAAFRAKALSQLGDRTGALHQLRQGWDLYPQVPEGKAREVALNAILDAEMELHLVAGDWALAVQSGMDQEERFGARTHAAIRRWVRLRVLRARFQLRPAQRGLILREVEAEIAASTSAGFWAENERRELEFMRWQAADAADDPEAVNRAAEAVADSLGGVETAGWVLDRLLGLLRSAPPRPATREFLRGRAADFVLARLLAGQLDAPANRLLESATLDDWARLAEHQRRLLSDADQLKAALAERWKPGLPAYDRLVSDGVIAICAWCGRVRDRFSQWVVATDSVRLSGSQMISHGICADCREDHRLTG